MPPICKNKYMNIFWLLLVLTTQPVKGQFISTYFRLTPGIEVIHLGNQKVKLASALEFSIESYESMIEFRAAENLEFLVEVKKTENQSQENSPSIRYYDYKKNSTVELLTQKTFQLKKSLIYKIDDGQKQLSASFSIPQNESGLIIIHHP